VAATIYIYIDSSDLQHYFPPKLKFMFNSTLLYVTTPSVVKYEGKDPRLTGELAFLSVM
jgi:hypothetical protein